MKNKLYLLTLLSIFAISAASCSSYKDPTNVTFKIADLGVVEIHTSTQKEYLNSVDKDSYVATHIDELVKFSNSTPKETLLSFRLISDNGETQRTTYIKLAESPDDLKDNYLKLYAGEPSEYYFSNLKTNTKYYYQVVGQYVSTFESEVRTFTTSEAPLRNLDVQGVENIRDLGGWNIGEGRVYKQGLIYRTAQFNYGGTYNDYVSEPTPFGEMVLLEHLKIKTEIDLRRTKEANDGYDEVNSITSSPLGDTVKYVSCPMVFGGKNVFTQKENKESLKLFFETLSDRNNYPIAFHCLRGTDRTGALAYVIGAMVGMNEEDLMTDYLFSNFANIGSAVRRSSISSLYVRGIAQSEGSTLSEKAMNYLINNIGIEKTTLDAIVDILVEE